MSCGREWYNESSKLSRAPFRIADATRGHPKKRLFVFHFKSSNFCKSLFLVQQLKISEIRAGKNGTRITTQLHKERKEQSNGVSVASSASMHQLVELLVATLASMHHRSQLASKVKIFLLSSICDKKC